MMERAVRGRNVVIAGSMAALLLLGACSRAVTAPPLTSVATAALPGPQATQQLIAPECTAPAAPTPPMTEGPYFKPGSPERLSLLEAGTTGEKLVLSGYVRARDCSPVANALLDFWQADGNGAYDNTGYGLRGHQFTDAAGRYQLTTVVPGLYPGRTEHIHVKLQAPGGDVLTTQLFFPNVPGNQTDQFFDQRLVIQLQQASDGWSGLYDFVLDKP